MCPCLKPSDAEAEIFLADWGSTMAAQKNTAVNNDNSIYSAITASIQGITTVNPCNFSLPSYIDIIVRSFVVTVDRNDILLVFQLAKSVSWFFHLALMGKCFLLISKNISTMEYLCDLIVFKQDICSYKIFSMKVKPSVSVRFYHFLCSLYLHVVRSREMENDICRVVNNYHFSPVRCFAWHFHSWLFHSWKWLTITLIVSK